MGFYTTSSRALRRSATITAALWVGFALVSCAGFRGNVERPDVHVANVIPLGTTGFEQRMRVDLRIINPNDFALDFDGLSFDLDLNGQSFARGVSNQRTSIPRLGDGIVTVETTTTLLDVLKQVTSMAGGPAPTGVDYRVTGRLFLTSPARRAVDFEREGRVGR